LGSFPLFGVISIEKLLKIKVRVMVFKATFNNISVISWQSDLLVEETRVSGENFQICHKSLTNFIT